MNEIEKAKSLDEQSSDVWRGVSETLDNYWWIVKIFDSYLILYYNGTHYQVNYSYDENDKVVIPDKSQWAEVKEEWVAKQMQENNAVIKSDSDNSNDRDKDAEDTEDTEDAELEVSFFAKSSKKQIVYSVVYEPMVKDSQGDWADHNEIEKMAHGYLRNHIMSQIPAADLQHEEDLPLEKAIPVESYIAPEDFNINEQLIKKGSWIVALHVPDNDIWQQIEKGEITGYSLKGKGLRIPQELA